jgi:hypothetical protein
MYRFSLFFSALFAAMLFSGLANAEGRAARIDYRVPSSCPAASDFLAGVSARTARLRAVTAREAETVTVRVQKDGDGFRGTLVMGQATREVTGGSCAEVVGALGLVLALAVDTEAVPAPSPPTPRAPPEPEKPAAPPHKNATSFAGGLGGGVTSGIAPDPMFSPNAFLELRLAGQGYWEPALRLSGTRAASGAFEVPGGGSARLTWIAGALDGCPVRFAWQNASAAPCLRIGAGFLSGSGDGVAHPRDDIRAWLDAGAVARIEIAVAHPIFLDLEGGAAVALTRPRFHFDVPDATIHQPAPVYGLAAAHAGVRFP